mgnify:CR=1 FL=1
MKKKGPRLEKKLEIGSKMSQGNYLWDITNARKKNNLD